MKIGVTVCFQNSYFSGAIPQVACAISRALATAGHDVTLLYPKGETNWFLDVISYAARLPPRKEWSSTFEFDKIVEVGWSFSPEDRRRVAKEVFHLLHYPPMFHDTESTVYPCSSLPRKFEGLRGLWTYDHFSKQDVRYLEFLSGLPVQTLPYVWDPEALDHFVGDERVSVVPSMSWCAQIIENNVSNSGSCIIPLNIVSEICRRGEPIRCTVHNGSTLITRPFFRENILKNLLIPDLHFTSERTRLPELRGDKTFLIAHQRFRQIKSYLLDALYLGIPMIHNCPMARDLGALYYYEDNQILDAVKAWRAVAADAASGRGFFDERKAEVRRATLVARFSPAAVSKAYNEAIRMCLVAPRSLVPAPSHVVQTPNPLYPASVSATIITTMRSALTPFWKTTDAV